MSNPYELSDKNEEELSRIAASMRQDAYKEGYAEGYKDGLGRFMPEVDTVPIPPIVVPRNEPNMAERTLLNVAKERDILRDELNKLRNERTTLAALIVNRTIEWCKNEQGGDEEDEDWQEYERCLRKYLLRTEK